MATIDIELRDEHVGADGCLTDSGLLYVNRYMGVSFLMPTDPTWEHPVATVRLIAFGRSVLGQHVYVEGRKRIDFSLLLACKLLERYQQDSKRPDRSQAGWLQIMDEYQIRDQLDSLSNDLTIHLPNKLTLLCRNCEPLHEVVVATLREQAEPFDSAIRALKCSILREWLLDDHVGDSRKISVGVWALDERSPEEILSCELSGFENKGVVVDDDKDRSEVARKPKSRRLARTKKKVDRSERRSVDPGPEPIQHPATVVPADDGVASTEGGNGGDAHGSRTGTYYLGPVRGGNQKDSSG